MIRRILKCFFALSLVLIAVLPARAAQTGSINLQTTGGTAALYLVGRINGQDIRLNEEFGGSIVEQEMLISTSYAAKLSQKVSSGKIKAADMFGEILFPELEPGLYLITQPSAPAEMEPFAPFLVCVPWDGEIWDIEVNLELQPQTGEDDLLSASVLGMLLSGAALVLSVFLPNKTKRETSDTCTRRDL